MRIGYAHLRHFLLGRALVQRYGAEGEVDRGPHFGDGSPDFLHGLERLVVKDVDARGAIRLAPPDCILERSASRAPGVAARGQHEIGIQFVADVDRATKEAILLGQTNPTLRQFAIDFGQSHRR